MNKVRGALKNIVLCSYQPALIYAVLLVSHLQLLNCRLIVEPQTLNLVKVFKLG